MKTYSFSIRNNEDVDVRIENIEASNEQQAMDKVLQMLTESIKHKALVKEYTYDEKHRIIALKQSNLKDYTGFWEKYEYDKNGNETYYENSRGYWNKSEYDDHGNKTYYENSDGIGWGTPRAELEQEPDITDD